MPCATRRWTLSPQRTPRSLRNEQATDPEVAGARAGADRPLRNAPKRRRNARNPHAVNEIPRLAPVLTQRTLAFA